MKWKPVVYWETPYERGSNNFLTTENLAKVGVKKENIVDIEPFFSFPGSLYTEQGVARPLHPCCGSVGINILTDGGQRASIQDIFYYDYGHKSNPLDPLKDIPHWNRENRFIGINNKEKRIPADTNHVIKASKWIEISFKNKEGDKIKQKINLND